VATLAHESGLPALERWDGVPLALRQPQDTTADDFRVFSSQSIDGGIGDLKSQRKSTFSGVGRGMRGDSVQSHNVCAEAVVVLSLPRHLLEPLPGYDGDPSLCRLPTKVLRALRPLSFAAVIDSAPWLEGVIMLPPSAIARSFLLQPVKGLEMKKATSVTEPENQGWVRETDELDSGTDISAGGGKGVDVVHVESVTSYIVSMKDVRRRCEAAGKQPLFHYTHPSVVPLILRGGLRMSTQGQGDGGVYFSTKSPVSYGLGKSTYEEAIIRDCFGVERLNEYRGQGKLDAVLVYCCEPSILQPAPGGRDNAKMVPRQTFQVRQHENRKCCLL